jgi:uncharacterized protein
MLRNSSRKNRAPHPHPMTRRVLLALALPLWVLISFVSVQLFVSAIVALAVGLGIPLGSLNQAVFNAGAGAIVYTVTLLVVIGVPWLVKRRATSREELGLSRLPTWLDIVITPVGFVVYIFLSGTLLYVAQQILTFVDFEQVQDVGFDQLTQQFEYVLAFLTLVVVAPIAEEILFRGYLLSKLRGHVTTWIAVLITSLLFSLVHFAWNVGIDVFALSIVLCIVTIWTKSLWPAIFIHMLKNGIAFYFLFINPTLLTTLGG